MFYYIWPILLVILANTVYHICTKSVPASMSVLASLIITYGVATIASLILFFVTSKGGSLVKEYQQLNLAPFALGIAIVGLEMGYIYSYKVGWPVSTAALVSSTLLALVLIFVGLLLYHEQLTWNKWVGIVICLVGLGFINMK